MSFAGTLIAKPKGEFMKNKKQTFKLFSPLTLTLFLLTGCGDSKQEGVASGGGGYSQRPTSQVLEVAKLSLAKTLETAPDVLFTEFPAEFNKSKLSEIIRKIEFRPTERRERDGSYLKLDYDSKTNAIFATYDFYIIYNVPSIFSMKVEDLNKMVEDIQKDILHEVSHLLGIGKSSETDLTSQLFGYYFMSKLKSAEYLCDSDNFQMKYSPYARTFLIRDKKLNLDEYFEDEKLTYLLEDHLKTMDSYDRDFGKNPLDIITEDYSEKFFGLISGDTDNGSIHQLSEWLLNPTIEMSGATLSMDHSEEGAFGQTQSDYTSSEMDLNNRSKLEFDGIRTLSTILSFTKNYSAANLVVFERFSSKDSSKEKRKNQLAFGDHSSRIEFKNCKTNANAFPLKLIQATPIKSLKDPNIEVIEESLSEF